MTMLAQKRIQRSIERREGEEGSKGGEDWKIGAWTHTGLNPGETHPESAGKPVQFVWSGYICQVLDSHKHDSGGYRGSNRSGAARHYLQDGYL